MQEAVMDENPCSELLGQGASTVRLAREWLQAR